MNQKKPHSHRGLAYGVPVGGVFAKEPQEVKETNWEMGRWCMENVGEQNATWYSGTEFIKQEPGPGKVWTHLSNYQRYFYFKTKEHAAMFKLIYGSYQ